MCSYQPLSYHLPTFNTHKCYAGTRLYLFNYLSEFTEFTQIKTREHELILS